MAENANITLLSEYFSTLESAAKTRYQQKVNTCGFDPYYLKVSDFKEDSDALPRIEYPDIVNYLVLQTSWLSSSQIKAYKSLEAYNFFISGWVSSLLTKEASNDRVVVFARVNHSQRSRETPLKTWVLAEKSGDVVLAHCNCMAGLGEACSHVGAILFACETAVKMRESVTCTQELSKWLPSHKKKVPYLEVSKVDFSSAKRQYKELTSDKENIPPTKQRRATTCTIVPPTQLEIAEFFEVLSASNSKSAVLSVVPPYNKTFKPKTLEIKSLTSLYNEDCTNLDYEQLINVCNNVNISITEKECKVIESRTRQQSESRAWFDQRSGRITASKLKVACHTNPEKPSKSLIKTICYPEAHKFTSTATQWGCSHENTARNIYERKMSTSHERFTVSDSGLNVNPKWPHMGASPDGFVNCDCCGKGACEVKCPYSIKDEMLDSAATKKGFCLTRENGCLTINKTHAYYYQVQAQIYICDIDYCDFVVWTTNDIHVERVLPDPAFWEVALAKATRLFQVAVLPEIVGRWFTRPAATSETTHISETTNADSESDDEEGPWCYCQEHLVGSNLIGCDNKKCDIVWFHMDCIGIDQAPKGKWYCPSCSQ